MSWYEEYDKYFVKDDLDEIPLDNWGFIDNLKSIISNNSNDHIKVIASKGEEGEKQLDTKVLVIVSTDKSTLYITDKYQLLSNIVINLLRYDSKWKIISINDKAEIDDSAGSIAIDYSDFYSCTLVHDTGKSSVQDRKEWEDTAIKFMTKWFNISGLKNKFSASFTELPSDLINEALALKCKVKIGPRKNASETNGLYHLTIIPPKNKDYTEEK